jgi:hypothetical protein
MRTRVMNRIENLIVETSPFHAISGYLIFVKGAYPNRDFSSLQGCREPAFPGCMPLGRWDALPGPASDPRCP